MHGFMRKLIRAPSALIIKMSSFDSEAAPGARAIKVPF